MTEIRALTLVLLTLVRNSKNRSGKCNGKLGLHEAVSVGCQSHWQPEALVAIEIGSLTVC